MYSTAPKGGKGMETSVCIIFESFQNLYTTAHRKIERGKLRTYLQFPYRNIPELAKKKKTKIAFAITEHRGKKT